MVPTSGKKRIPDLKCKTDHSSGRINWSLAFLEAKNQIKLSATDEIKLAKMAYDELSERRKHNCSNGKMIGIIAAGFSFF